MRRFHQLRRTSHNIQSGSTDTGTGSNLRRIQCQERHPEGHLPGDLENLQPCRRKRHLRSL
nr:MAG TPA: hypothetical protein [Caudoviricetes sp.]